MRVPTTPKELIFLAPKGAYEVQMLSLCLLVCGWVCLSVPIMLYSFSKGSYLSSLEFLRVPKSS